MCLLLLLPHTLTLLWPWVCPCRQSFKNCSSMASFLRVQSLGSRLLQHSPPWDHRSCQKSSCMGSSPWGLPGACSNRAFPWAAASFRAHPSAPAGGPPWSALWISAYLWALPVSLRGLGLGTGGLVLELAVSVMGAAPGFSHKPPPQPLAAKTWLCKPNTPLNVSQERGRQGYLSFEPF